uniref:SMODS and SLOG-associating 2TM effector domain-containing protein n=1 Tax=Panagrolaimus sp. ES5 TaxID=591445 RepID=A0AC34FSC3_9BILA
MLKEHFELELEVKILCDLQNALIKSKNDWKANWIIVGKFIILLECILALLGLVYFAFKDLPLVIPYTVLIPILFLLTAKHFIESKLDTIYSALDAAITDLDEAYDRVQESMQYIHRFGVYFDQ